MVPALAAHALVTTRHTLPTELVILLLVLVILAAALVNAAGLAPQLALSSPVTFVTFTVMVPVVPAARA